MSIEGFDEILNTLYIAKELYDMGKYGLAKENFHDVLDYDFYFEDMYGLAWNVFKNCSCTYYDRQGMEVSVLSDPVVTDFCTLAGEYGKTNKIPDESNPYIREAEREVRERLNFSYCLDSKFMAHTGERASHSRIGIFIYQDDYVDPGSLAYGLIRIYEWFSDACTRLRNILKEKDTGGRQNSRKEAVAA